MTLTANASWRLGGVPQPGVVYAHNAYCYRCPFGLTYPDCNVKCAQDAEDLIRTTTSGRIAGFIAEPIQGVGGFITPPREYFQIVAGIVRKYGGIFISDEVQTAWGRTGGKWFGIEQYGVTPDIITSAKGLGNGFPIGLTVARPEVAAAVKGATISTFGGNPMAATAGKAVLDYIEEQNLRVNAAEVGAHLRERLLELQEKHSLIGEVRGMGLMQAIELVEDRKTKVPAAAAMAQLMEATRENRIMVGKGGLYGNVMRITPPLNIGKTDVDEFAKLLDRSFVQCRVAASV
jgi:4-aminobutyrate aminotransferase